MSHHSARVEVLYCLCVLGFVASCHENVDAEQGDLVSRVVPAKVSSAEAWRLFDRSVSSGYAPSGDVVKVELDHAQTIVAVKVRGPSPYVLAVTGSGGGKLASIDLSGLAPGWQTIPTKSPVATDYVELGFRALGESSSVPELELWATDRPAERAAARTLTFAASETARDLAPGQCEELTIKVDRPPALFRRLDVAYESVGAIRTFAVERSINGRASQGGTWLEGDASKPQTLREQIDPAHIAQGENRVRICVPNGASRAVSINNLRLVGELDRGVELTTKATLGGGAEAAALIDENPDTNVEIAANERVLLEFDRLVAPDALVLDAGVTPGRVDCIEKDGSSVQLNAVDIGDAIKLDGGAKACRALSVTFASAVTLASLDVVGSGAEETVDWPHIVITSLPEHFGARAWVSGFVARPPAMTGAIRTNVAGLATEAMTGDFGRWIDRPEIRGPWTVDVGAVFPNNTQQIQKIVLTDDSSAGLVADHVAVGNAATLNAKRYGEISEVTAVKVSLDVESKIRVGTLVGLDIPAGAVKRPTTIRGKHLDGSNLPPLDAGMINVTAPKGHGYEFLPHGQRFAKAIDVLAPFDTTLIPQGMSMNEVYTFYYDTSARHWKKLQRTAIDLGDHTTRSATDHFTIMINAVLATPTNPKPLTFDPTAASSVASASPATNLDFIQPPSANSSGDANLMLPIRLPSGRGYTPALALAYASSAGNGWVGVGWALSTPKIEIDTRWGVPSYATTEEPRYLLDGAEIVPTSDSDGPTCANGRRYHMRIEGAFSHILRCGTGPSNYSWEVRDRNGTKYTYGGTTNSVLASYRSPFGVFRWNLRDVTDVHGNNATYTYAIDEIAASAGGEEASRESYVSSIEYSQHAALTGKYRIDFVRDDGNRKDPIINGRPGFKVKTRHLLRQLRVSLNDGSGVTTIREYVLTYAEGQFGKTVLARIGVYGTSGCTAGVNAFVLPTSCEASFFHDHKFTYYNESDGLVGFGAPTQWTMLGDPNPAKATITKGDSKTKTKGLSLSASAAGTGASASAGGSSGDRSELIALQDMNGDGLVDQVFGSTNLINGNFETTVLYNQSNNPPGAHSFAAPGVGGFAVTGLNRLGHERSSSWSVDAKFGINPKGLGASASGGYSNSKSFADTILTDFDGDGFVDQINTNGQTLRSDPCPTGQCFTSASFDATSLIDPKLDPALTQADAEVSERLMLGDPIVQWVAPYNGTLTLTANAQKRHSGGVDGVTIELWQRVIGTSPTQDVLAATSTIPAGSTTPVSLSLTAISATAGQQFYMRLRTGDAGIDKTGLLYDEVDASISADYLTTCTAGTCTAVPAAADQPHDPTDKSIFSFSQVLDTRVNGTKPLALPSAGTIRFKGTIMKARSAAPVTVCLQQFSSSNITADGSFDRPCNSEVPYIQGMYFTEAETVSQTYDLTSIPVQSGDFVVLRVESGFSIDPDVISVQPADGTPYVTYTQVCTPSANGQTSCSTDPDRVAQVPVDLSTFGIFFAPVSQPSPLGAIPWATKVTTNATWSIDVFDNPLYPMPITVTIRSSTRGTLATFTCPSIRPTCGRYTALGRIRPTPPFSVVSGESISFEITASSVSSAPEVLMIPGSFGNAFEVPAFFRKTTADQQMRTPFVDARRGFHVTFWNENEPFAPSLLLEDYATLNSATPPSDQRLVQMMRSAVEPLPYSNNPLSYTATSPEPTWAGPGSVAFMTPHGHANAADIGVMQDDSSGPASVFLGSYARLSCTRSYYVGAEVGMHGVTVSPSLSGNVGSGDTSTTTDVIDLNGDGIADVLAGNTMHVSTLVGGAVRSFGNLGIGNGFRRRTSRDYSFGFGGSASFPVTTAGGRRRSMGSQDEPDHNVGIGESEGISLGRSQTTHDLVDVNGDGLPDLVARTNNSINVRYNLGDRFDNWTPFGTVDASLANAQIDTFQGFEDAENVQGSLALKTNQNALAHETTITQNKTYTVDLYYASASYTTKTTSSRVTRQFADLNGDGLPDLLMKKAGEGFIRVQYNTGGGFGLATTWTTPAWEGEVFPAFATSAAFSDLFTGSRAVGGPDVLASTGTQDSTAYSGSVSIPVFSKVSVGLSGGVAYEKDTYELGLVDVTGDGAPDHVLRRGASNDPQYTYVKPNLANGRSNLLKTVTGPLGGEISLEYALSLPSIDMPHARQTLSKVTVDDKSPSVLDANYSSPNLVTQFTYAGGYHDRLEKEFLGFADVTAIRADGQSVTSHYENHDFTLHGSLLQETRTGAGQPGPVLHKRVITRTARNVTDANGTNLVPHPGCLSNLHALLGRLGNAPCTPKFAVITKDEDIRYEGSATKTRTIEDLSFDRFGNASESLDRGDDALSTDDVYSSVTYQNDATRWILGRPTVVQARAGSSTGTVLRSRRGLYDVNGQLYQLEVDTGTSPPVATTNLTYDTFGNLETLSTPTNEQGQRQTYTLAYDPTLKTYVTTTTDAFGYQSQSTYDLRFGVALTDTHINGESTIRTLDAFGRLATIRGPYDTQTGDGITLTYFHLENPPRAISVTKATKPSGATGTPPAAIQVETITNGLGEAIELRKTGVVNGVAGIITAGLIQRDALGRVTRSYQPFFTSGASSGFITPASTLSVATTYDDLDRAIVTTYPDSATETVNYSIQTTSSGTSLFRVQTTNTDNHQQVAFIDLNGLTREYVEYPDASAVITKYDYAPTGELTQITDADSRITTVGYDLRGLRTSLRNPDTGLITDTFDAMGNRITTQEPNHRKNGVSVQFKYNRDRLERIIYPAKPAIRTCASGATASVCYDYGSASGDPLSRGNLVSVQDESGSQVYTYGQLGEIRETVRTVAPPSVAAVLFDHRYVYDSLGHLLSIRYPDGESVINTYDAAGKLNQVVGATFGRTYATDIRYDVFGNRTHLTYGNNVQSSWTFDQNRVRPTGVTTTLPSGRAIQGLSYSYTNSGRGLNFASIANNIFTIDNQDPTNTPGPSTITATYDGVDRLLTVTGSAQLNAQKTTSYDEVFTYSSTHNLLTKQRIRREFQTGTSNYSYDPGQQIDRCSSPPCNPATYTYATSWDAACNGGDTGTRPHLPSQIGTSNFGVLIQYDCSGNPLSRQKSDTGSTQLLIWDDDGRLTDTQEAGVHQHNTYDASGLRVRRASSGGGQNNVTIYSSIYFDLEGSTQGLRHVFAGELRVATELSSFASSLNPPAPSAEGTRYFFHADHLNSTAVVTDQNTTNPSVYQSTEYYVDGDEWLDRAPQNATNQYLFDGKPFDKDTGFYDYGQRFYDPRTSLWLGVDPAFTESANIAIGDSRQLSVAAFAANNPTRFVDPDGRGFWDAVKWALYDMNPLIPSNLIELGRGNLKRSVSITGHRLAAAAPFVATAAGVTGFSVAVGIGTSSVLSGLATYTETGSVDAAANATSWSLAGGMFLNEVAPAVAKFAARTGRPTIRGSNLDPTPATVQTRSYCFAAGTKVLMADGSTKAIEDVREGDYVLASDPETASHAETHKVTALHRNATYRFFHIDVGEREQISATGSHQFWTQRGWVTSEQLTTKDLLTDVRGKPITIRSITVESTDAATFNLSVDQTHTFYVVVGSTPVLVHNEDPWDILFTQNTYNSTFNEGPWTGRTVAEAIDEARALGRLPDGLRLEAIRMGDGRWATLNNRTLAVARGANLPSVEPVDVGDGGMNKYNRLLRESGLSGPVQDAVMRCP